MGNRQDEYVVIVATGGTISSRVQAEGLGAVAADRGTEILNSLRTHPPVPVRVIDVEAVGSYLLTVTDMLTICATIRDALNDPLALGVVVTHGTDTMEETAYLADLTLQDDRPVVFTGAQRSADAADPDGPDNLLGAILVAASPEAAGRGVLLCFAGELFPAKGVRKSETLALRAFSNPASGVAGSVTDGGEIRFTARRGRRRALALPSVDGDAPRVDLVPVYPGADENQLMACAGAGAAGIVLEATGSGNANQRICDAVARLTEQGMIVVTSTRVHAGPVVPIYGAGGGKSLLAAGAIPSGLLRPSQSLVLLSLLLRLALPRGAIAEMFAREGGPEHPHDRTSDPPEWSSSPPRPIPSP